MDSNTNTEKSESPSITENELDINNEKSNKVVANLNGKIVDTDDNQIIESEMTENESVSKTDETESNEFEETTTVDENKVLEEPKKETELDNIKDSTETQVIASNKNDVAEEVKNVSEIAKELEDNKNNPENTKEKVIKPRKRKVSDKPTEDMQAELKAELADVDIFSSGPSEILGKGKRARIPNKRYSDILMSPSHSRKSTTNSSENGSMDKLDSGNDTDGSTRDEPVLAKKQKLSSDISHPKYLKPFQFGWRRELVWRGTFDENKVRTGDVFYYSPEGKKIKSMKELVDSLVKNKELTTDNFSFAKEVIGIDDPEKEIIREAKTLKTPETLVKHVITKNTPKSPKLANQRIAGNKVTSPKLANSPRTLPNKPAFIQTADSSVRTRTPRMGKNNVKMKGPIKKEPKDARKSLDKPPVLEKMEVDQSPSKVTPARRGRKSCDGDGSEVVGASSPNKPCQPCSIRCKGVHGIVPTLQCRICLCLYHHECVGVSPSLNISVPYVCKNCHLDGQEQTPDQSATILNTLPPLTPINTLPKSTGIQSTTLPKLQRIPRHTDQETVESESFVEPPVLTPRPQSESFLGSLTTWLPHNSKIIDNIQEDPPLGSVGVPRPQYVEILAGRKFLVIPKHNFMSVSPTMAASAVSRNEETPVNVDSVSLGSEPSSDIKVEPDSPSKPENSQTPEAMEVEGFPDDGTEAEKKDCSGSSEKDAVPTPVTPPVAPPKVTSKKRTIKLSSITNSEERDENKFMDNYLQNLSYGYSTLLYVFQYLKVQDLLRAGCVCTMWRDIASHPALWRTVRMKNSQVHSFEGLANSLRKHGTRHLDLRKMLLPNGGDEIWPAFSNAIAKVETLRRIELCRCPASVVEKLGESNPQLEVINAVTIKCESMNLEPLKALTEIKELRLKSTGGLSLTSNIDSLREMKALIHLSLTSIRDLDKMNLNVIAELTNLESLDLGECTDFPKNFGGEILIKLTKLEKLRLEKGQGNCHTFEILEAVQQMSKLDQLELVNFDIKTGFDKALGVCQNIRKLLIIPTYISQSATTNHMVLGGVLRLQKTLSHFVWGVTLELLRVTELFVDQCEEPKEKSKKQMGNGDCIPVLKPVPVLLDKDSEIAPALEPPQVEILALPSLQKLLMQTLPTTRVKILKIPFHATWRQSITDSVN